jgi:simple sugar transport system permease protein
VATAGISVFRLKYIGVLLSGIFAGLGGAALVLTQLGLFAPNMTAGRGFIVLAALVLGKWNPIWVALACTLFGAADALQLRLQTFSTGIPYQIPVMLPYILTVAALAGLVGRTVPPKTAGQPYDPQSH